MSPPRPIAVVAAAVAAVTAYACVAVHGAPPGIAQLATIGESDVEARGGVVFEVRVDAPPGSVDRGAIASVLGARLEAQGARVATDDVDAHTFRIAGAGLLPERADAIAAGLRMRGGLALRPVLDHGGDVDRVAGVKGGGVRVETDHWQSPDGVAHTTPYVSAGDRAALASATAGLATDPGDEVLIADESRGPDAGGDHRFRTYVVAREVLIGNHDIEEAVAGSDPYNERPVVNLTFTRDGADRFGDWTAAHTGEKLAIVVDGEVTSAPVVNSAIRGGKAVITMGTAGPPREAWDQARALAAALATHDELPAPIHVRVIDARDPSVVRARLAAMIAALIAAMVAAAIAWALGRWRALVPAPASVGRAHGAIRAGALALRLAVTIAVPIAIVWLGRIELPLGERRFPVVDTPTLTSLGVYAVIDAYLLVELAALIVPAWRARRLGGRAARQPLLVATAALAAALAIVQAWLVATYLLDVGYDVERWEIVAMLCAGALAYPLGAAAIDRWGLGSGWGVILAVPVIGWVQFFLEHGNATTIALGLGEGALAILIVVGAARTRVRGARGAARLPLGGLVATTIGLAIVMFVFDVLEGMPGTGLLVHRVMFFFARPSVQVMTAIVVGGALGAAWSRRLDGGARAAAIAASIGIALAITAIELAAARAGDVDGAALAFAAAAIADVIVDARARARGRWRELAQTGDVDRADELLGEATALRPRFARALHVRALLRFFGPFAPVRVFEADPDA